MGRIDLILEFILLKMAERQPILFSVILHYILLVFIFTFTAPYKLSYIIIIVIIIISSSSNIHRMATAYCISFICTYSMRAAPPGERR